MFFSPIFDKISRSKIKIRTFCDFFDSKFELYGSKFDTKNDQKNHVKKEFQGSVVGGWILTMAKLDVTGSGKKSTFFLGEKTDQSR